MKIKQDIMYMANPIRVIKVKMSFFFFFVKKDIN